VNQDRSAAPDGNAPPRLAAAAALEHLTGAQRGTVSWLDAGALDLRLSSANKIEISAGADAPSANGMAARLERTEDGYVLTAVGACPIWINGQPSTQAPLANGDIIEFGENGPLSRFHFYRDGRGERRTVAVILRDCRDYIRVSRQPLYRRLLRAGAALTRRLARETTILFRVSVVLAIALLIWFAYRQQHENVQLAEALRSSEARVEQIAAALARARGEALRAVDLNALRDEMAHRLGSQRDRLSALEARSGAAGRIIAASVASVAFVQGAFRFREKESGRFLRHIVDADGNPLLSPFGRPMLSLEGNGEPIEIQYTGTGFAIADAPVLVTNRHVAFPWEDATSLPGDGLEPVMTRFQAYFPGHPKAVAVELLTTSETADLALLKVRDPSAMPDIGLRLSATAPKPGDEVIVLGYPTGLKSLLAQSGEAFVEKLQADSVTDFWKVAQRLAAEGFIHPLASRGIIGQATPAAVVYDAETTHGGSGGPVLDMEGRIVAVNSAILPEYGGSNFGVPIVRLRALIEQAGYR